MKLKEVLGAMLVFGLILLGWITFTNNIEKRHQKELADEARVYKECIEAQSEKQGYIIRSYCSLNYKTLDQVADLEYIQKGI